LQDRYAMLAPVAAVILFLLAITTSFLYLRLEELDRDQETVRRDTQHTQQFMRLRLLEQQELLMRMARDLGNRELDRIGFMSQAERFVTQTPEIFELTWMDSRRKVLASFSDASAPSAAVYYPGEVVLKQEVGLSFDNAMRARVPQYTSALELPGGGEQIVQLHLPVLGIDGPLGVLMAQYSADALLRYGIPADLKPNYTIALLDSEDKLLVGNLRKPSNTQQFLPWGAPEASSTMPISPMNNGLLIKLQAFRTSQGLVGTAVYWLVAALSVMTAWMLIGTFRHTRKRIRAQEALQVETSFRRAMENSMVTGMRALDMNGQIVYVNPAFSHMTGWSESELVGRTAPFPYWPDEDKEVLTNRLSEELQGKTIPGGFEMRVKRKNGSIFDARMYVSPLIDAQGHQTGWMTAMTDITEPKRIREELSAAHERFTTVLEGLDAAVSVAPLGSSELLFANRKYRQWFGASDEGHNDMVALAGLHPRQQPGDTGVDEMAGLANQTIVNASDGLSDSAEIYLDNIQMWLEVRSRYMTWVDGRLVQILIASDISARRQAEELAQQQTEKAQTASRLITMGEMASSVAHELNQPLTAINNYCIGLISRIKSGHLREPDLLLALDKTARQAQRAGQIIQRIRSFVKKSEPNRTWSDVNVLVSEAVELVEIDLRRKNVRLHRHLGARLPRIHVDPILIEQVLVNLIKNAAESIDYANRPSGHRNIELRVVLEEPQQITFTVQDTGGGLGREAMDRLYEAFFSTKTEGMGIGLSLCRSIIESHQGKMQAENLYNDTNISGCRFTVWLPIGKPPTP